MTTTQDNLSSYKDLFQHHLTAYQQAPQWLKDLQIKSFDQFLKQGLPTRKNENWRYTNLKSLSQKKLIMPQEKAQNLPQSLIHFANTNAIQLVFINGSFSQQHSSEFAQMKGIKISSLSEAVIAEENKTKEFFKNTEEKNTLINLNNALFTNGLLIEIGKEAKIEKPLQIFHIQTEEQESEHLPLTSPRHLVIARPYSGLSIQEFSLSEPEANYFTNSVINFHLEEGAQVQHSQIQLESKNGIHIHNTKVVQEQFSKYQSLHFSFGAKILRHNLYIDLIGEEANTELYGLAAVKKQHHLDHHIEVEHRVPHTNSDQVYKAVIQDHGKSVFNGKVTVHKDAQQTSANQLNKNIILGDKADANTKPELEILADDVKCSHGATIGQIDPEELFYLQSRAIEKDTALKMLIHGFAEDVLQKENDTQLKEKLSELLQREFFS